MKTLYVSDLDGTLLGSDEKTSEYTNRILNGLIESGLLFSYATARGYLTSRKVTEGLNVRLPVVVHNGTMIADCRDGSIIGKNTFGEMGKALLDTLLAHNIQPLVYALIDGEQKFSFIESRCSKGTRVFLDTRRNDPRLRPVETVDALYDGEIYYFTCIDDEEKLRPLYEMYRAQHHCVFDREFYTREYWLEIMPKEATKANAIRQLKHLLGCDKVVVFGDGLNDVDMFQMADEAYAVQNAAEELKQIATAVIGTNDEDAVADWLAGHCTR